MVAHWDSQDWAEDREWQDFEPGEPRAEDFDQMASIIGILGGGPLVSTKGAQGAIQGQAS